VRRLHEFGRTVNGYHEIDEVVTAVGRYRQLIGVGHEVAKSLGGGVAA
jgi:hypothetical protein